MQPKQADVDKVITSLEPARDIARGRIAAWRGRTQQQPVGVWPIPARDSGVPKLMVDEVLKNSDPSYLVGKK